MPAGNFPSLCHEEWFVTMICGIMIINIGTNAGAFIIMVQILTHRGFVIEFSALWTHSPHISPRRSYFSTPCQQQRP
jgi:hypothetical protein